MSLRVEPGELAQRGRRLAALAALALLFLAATVAGSIGLAHYRHPYVVAVMLCQAPLYGAAAWLVLRHGHGLRSGPTLLVILGTAILARAVLLPFPPISTDIYRYIWDGRVQADGINPYRFLPADPRLQHLRDGTIYRGINRADTAPTIYPPAAQMIFLAATRIAETVTIMKAALVAFEGLVVWGLVGWLRSRGLPPARLLLYLWHPLPLWEIAGSGHVDAAAIGLMWAALLAAERRKPGWAGMLLALGAGVKYFPAFVAPALYRRFGWPMPAAFAATIAAIYLPYLGAGWGVFGYLFGYAQEEGLSAGGGVFWLALVGTLWPPAAAALAKPYLATAALCLLGLGIAIALRSRPERVSLAGAQWLLVAFIVAMTPHYPWYIMCLVPFLCIAPTYGVAYLTLAAPLLYGMVWPFSRFPSEALIYLPFVALVAVNALLRRGAGRRRESLDGSRSGPRPAA